MNSILKKISVLFTVGILLFSCEEQTFDDFDYRAVYFPHQFPVRTISLGDDYIPNENDQLHKFEIGVVIGGMYENTQDWTVYFEIEESLADSLVTGSGDTIYVLPSEYYSMSNSDYFTIPAGSFNGTIEIQLTDAFFNDSLSTNVHYVIPLKITDTNADTILSGLPREAVQDPDPRFESDWESGKSPKNFTLFGVKYVNTIHGNYLYRGFDIKTFQGDPIDTTISRKRYIEDSEIWSLKTTSLNSVSVNAVSFRISSEGLYKMELIVKPDNSVTISSLPGSLINPYQKSDGEPSTYVKDGAEWGGKPRDVMYLNYFYMEGGVLEHIVHDTIVFRDRGISFEVFKPIKY